MVQMLIHTYSFNSCHPQNIVLLTSPKPENRGCGRNTDHHIHHVGISLVSVPGFTTFFTEDAVRSLPHYSKPELTRMYVLGGEHWFGQGRKTRTNSKTRNTSHDSETFNSVDFELIVIGSFF